MRIVNDSKNSLENRTHVSNEERGYYGGSSLDERTHISYEERGHYGGSSLDDRTHISYEERGHYGGSSLENRTHRDYDGIDKRGHYSDGSSLENRTHTTYKDNNFTTIVEPELSYKNTEKQNVTEINDFTNTSDEQDKKPSVNANDEFVQLCKSFFLENWFPFLEKINIFEEK